MLNSHEKSKFEFLLNQYGCSIETANIVPVGNGLINKTYRVECSDKAFILQNINRQVFPQPHQVIDNADLINRFLKEEKNLNRYNLELIPQIKTSCGENFIDFKNKESSEIETWRALKIINNSKTIESVENPIQAGKVASAFAQFSRALGNINTNLLTEVIPDFHNLEFRIQQLETAVSQNLAGRKTRTKKLLEFCAKQSSFIKEVIEISSKLPVRVTHNDTKINNLLFETTSDEPIAVIDLDTCMPGFVMNDFGDMVRTCCSNLPEDGTHLERMELQLDVFEALSNGYQKSFNNELTRLEKRSLVIGAQLLPFIIGIRFLTDFLNGDTYFGTSYPDQNYFRAANQLHLYSLLSQNDNELYRIVEQFVS